MMTRVLLLALSLSLTGCPHDWPEPYLRIRQEGSCLLGRDIPRAGPEREPSPACLAYRRLSPEERAQIDAWLGGHAVCAVDMTLKWEHLTSCSPPGRTIVPERVWREGPQIPLPPESIWGVLREEAP